MREDPCPEREYTQMTSWQLELIHIEFIAERRHSERLALLSVLRHVHHSSLAKKLAKQSPWLSHVCFSVCSWLLLTLIISFCSRHRTPVIWLPAPVLEAHFRKETNPGLSRVWNQRVRLRLRQFPQYKYLQVQDVKPWRSTYEALPYPKLQEQLST